MCEQVHMARKSDIMCDCECKHSPHKGAERANMLQEQNYNNGTPELLI